MDIQDNSKGHYVYDSDRGVNLTIIMRNAYAADSGLVAGFGAAGPMPPRSHPRHLWVAVVDNNRLVRRKVPCSKAVAATAQAGTTTVNADGLALVMTGYVGEKSVGW